MAMNENDKLIKLYTGGDVIVSRITQELETHGITPLLKDGFKQGIAAGFVEGVPSAIDIFVTAKDFDKAKIIVTTILEK